MNDPLMSIAALELYIQDLKDHALEIKDKKELREIMLRIQKLEVNVAAIKEAL